MLLHDLECSVDIQKYHSHYVCKMMLTLQNLKKKWMSEVILSFLLAGYDSKGPTLYKQIHIQQLEKLN